MKALLSIILLMVATSVAADKYVSPHFRNDGSYVGGHIRSNPNTFRFDNYSSKGNTNPYTGERGYKKNEFTSPPAYNSSKGTYRYGRSR